jgi:hypothetical protein
MQVGVPMTTKALTTTHEPKQKEVVIAAKSVIQKTLSKNRNKLMLQQTSATHGAKRK